MESVQVEIFGQVYTIKGDHDPAYIRDLAAFVDGKMREVQKGTGTADPHRVAILTALTISDELYELKDRSTAFEKKAESGIRRLLELTENPETFGTGHDNTL